MRKICFVTGSRAEYGLLSRLMKYIDSDNELTLQIIATNMHLSPEHGSTYKEIEKDGFIINKKVEMLLSSDSPNATTKSVGLAVIGFSDAYEDLKPDIIVVLGDRFEILAAVTAALFYKIPVAHIHGGEITEGAFDDAIRHAITKMSHLHFTSTEIYRKRVIQMGENPDTVFNVGALGVENIKNIKLLSKQELENSLSFLFGEKNLLITYHPVTLEENTSEEQISNLLHALSELKNYKLIFTMPNSDTNNISIRKAIEEFANKNSEKSIVFDSLGLVRYLSCLQFVNAVIGNSSSGIIEVPSFGIPTLDIGNRQKGRISATSVIHCGSSLDQIKDGLIKIESVQLKKEDLKNPYEKEGTAYQIYSIIKNYKLNNMIHKHFHSIEHA